MSISTANPPSVDIKDVLVDELGYTFGTDLFIGHMPNKVSNCICIYDTGGFGQEVYDYEKPTIQIRIKNSSYTTGYEKARDIKYKLCTGLISNRVVNGTRYIMILNQSDILYIGRSDSKKKFLFTVNFLIHRSGT